MGDSEKVIKEYEDYVNHYISLTTSYDYELEMHKAVLALLKEQEMKTGKWIEQTDCMGDTYYDCSVCNESWMTIEGTPWVNGMNYCPHCGARME